jgi:hypothetical protein
MKTRTQMGWLLRFVLGCLMLVAISHNEWGWAFFVALILGITIFPVRRQTP